MVNSIVLMVHFDCLPAHCNLQGHSSLTPIWLYTLNIDFCPWVLCTDGTMSFNTSLYIGKSWTLIPRLHSIVQTLDYIEFTSKSYVGGLRKLVVTFAYLCVMVKHSVTSSFYLKVHFVLHSLILPFPPINGIENFTWAEAFMFLEFF